MRCKLLQKRFAGKTTERSKHLRHIAIEKNILSELNRCIFEIPLKYIKLVIPTILFLLVLWYYSLYWYYTGFKFYFKIMWPPSTKIKNSDPQPPLAKTSENFNPPSPQAGGGCAYPESSIKTKSLNTKPCPAGLSPRIICQASPFLPKMSQNCCTHQVWTVPPSPEPLWVTLGMGKNPTQQPKIYSFPPSEKSPLIDLNLSLSKVSFLPRQTAIFK